MEHTQDLSPLEERLGHVFKDKGLLIQAITHRSYLNEHVDFLYAHNERLEFLGDAVLELIVTEHLYLNYANPEGELTTWRSALVNAKTLAGIADQLQFEEFLLLSKGEARDAHSKARMYILANAIEAIIGAIYLDGGTSAATKFVDNYILSHLPFILKNLLYVDPKSRFQETAQEMLGVTPTYKVLSETGPDHNKEFTVGLFVEKEMIAVGRGTSKQEAQVAAAEAGLEAKGWDVKAE
ncbi:ribonuclease III [Patescibacteria group bacterium]|nr:ribonuclease III [Patescibacteria group bacterium]MBU1448331.1 ribonuclease III [Patescibacteria group bacterium]MBU2613137.1 ribonuclease III [Patescibacteria group bacterium]